MSQICFLFQSNPDAPYYCMNKAITSTRKRDTDEGRPKNREEALGLSTSRQGSISSTIAFTSVSGGTHTTATTIKAGVNDILSSAQKLANR
ncbi:hypothetical protein MFLAVUS_005336 [Mucor flavus]|uniref:Uncharacterized protein n=1 Tax=Mucor flavus TaxID=439312 RepID=A0ABP9YYD8_9FUNG